MAEGPKGVVRSLFHTQRLRLRARVQAAFPNLLRPYHPRAQPPPRPIAPPPMKRTWIDRLLDTVVEQNDLALREAQRHIRAHHAVAHELARVQATTPDFVVQPAAKQPERDPRLLSREQFDIDTYDTLGAASITRNEIIATHRFRLHRISEVVDNWALRRRILQHYRELPDPLPPQYHDKVVYVPPRRGFGAAAFGEVLHTTEARFLLGFDLEERLTEATIVERHRLLATMNGVEHFGSQIILDRLDAAKALLLFHHADGKPEMPGQPPDDEDSVLDEETERLMREREKEIQEFYEERTRKAATGQEPDDEDDDLPPETVEAAFKRGTTEDQKRKWKEEQMRDRLRKQLIREAQARQKQKDGRGGEEANGEEKKEKDN